MSETYLSTAAGAVWAVLIAGQVLLLALLLVLLVLLCLPILANRKPIRLAGPTPQHPSIS